EAQQPPRAGTTTSGSTSGTNTGSGTTAATTPAATPLTLDQIAALKGKTGWGEVFKQMQAQGLVQAKSLGQIVSHREHQLHAPGTAASSRTVVTAASGRTAGTSAPHGHSTDADEAHGKAGAGDDLHIASSAGSTSSSAVGTVHVAQGVS